MKNLIEGIPYILLVVLTPFLFLTGATIAQAIIIAAIAGLSGYRYYLDSIKQPDYVKMFEEELSKIKKENREFADKYGKMAMERGAKKPLDNSFRW